MNKLFTLQLTLMFLITNSSITCMNTVTSLKKFSFPKNQRSSISTGNNRDPAKERRAYFQQFCSTPILPRQQVYVGDLRNAPKPINDLGNATKNRKKDRVAYYEQFSPIIKKNV